MKLFTKIIVCVFFSFLSVSVFAQSQWSITGGYLNTAVVATDRLWGDSSSGNENGFYLGIFNEILLPNINNFYLEPAILYSFSGDKNGDNVEAIHTANVPLRFKYKANVSKQMALFGFFGPVFSLGLSATNKIGGQTYSLYGNDGIMNRGDIKLGIGGGVELSSFLSFRIGYDWGLFNASKVSGVNAKINYFHAGVSVAL